MAEAFLGQAAFDRGLDVTASSAGTLPGERDIPYDTLDAIGRGGLDMTGHRSRLLTPELVAGADLVLGMGQEHVREVVMLDDDAWLRSFTLREIVRRGSKLGPRRPDQEFHQWLSLVHAGRQRRDLLGPDTGDNIADPVEGGRSVVKATAREIRDLTTRLLELIAS